MQISLDPGKYVVAVSGGVDSVALLHILQQLRTSAAPGTYGLTVAHFDHGIRPDSAEDHRFVRELARQYGLPYIYGQGALGVHASEAAARKARYDFLRTAQAAAGAQAIVTAHHMDDALETAVHNIIRGTGRRGLTSLQSTESIKRPLLHVPKQEIIAYAVANQLEWREDSTNASNDYTRNYIRHNILTRFEPQQRQRLHDIILSMHHTNAEIDALVAQIIADGSQDGRINRHMFLMLPHAAAREVMVAWLRSHDVDNIDKKLLERLVHAGKTFQSGRKVSVGADRIFVVQKSHLALQPIERYNKPVYG